LDAVGLGLTNNAIGIHALDHKSAGVRRNAILAMDRSRETAVRIQRSNLLQDPDTQVKLAALLTLADIADQGYTVDPIGDGRPVEGISRGTQPA